MAKGKLIEQLDDAVEAIMAKPDASLPTSDPRLAAILRIAGELRDLPRADFRNRLKADLAAQSKELGAVARPSRCSLMRISKSVSSSWRISRTLSCMTCARR